MDRFEVVRIGEETSRIDIVTSFDAEPEARKTTQTRGLQAVGAARVADPRQIRSKQGLDVSQRLDLGFEETSTDGVAAPQPVLLASLYRIGLGQRLQSDIVRTAWPSAWARSWSTTSGVNGRPSPDSSPSAISMRKQRPSSTC